MNKKQKKIIWIMILTFAVAASIASLSLFIAGYVGRNEILKFVGNITAFITPSTIIGILAKTILNKKHIKQVNRTLEQHNVKLSDKEEQEANKIDKKAAKSFQWKTYHFFEKEGKVIIKYTTDAKNKDEEYEEMREAMFKYINKKRLDANKNK